MGQIWPIPANEHPTLAETSLKPCSHCLFEVSFLINTQLGIRAIICHFSGGILKDIDDFDLYEQC